MRIFFSTFSNFCHCTTRFNRIFSTCSFTTQHQSVRVTINCICNIGNLSTSWSWVVNHCMQHLGCDNYRLAFGDTFTDNSALDTWDFFNRNLNTQIATSNHNTIRSINNFFNVINTLLVFNF